MNERKAEGTSLAHLRAKFLISYKTGIGNKACEEDLELTLDKSGFVIVGTSCYSREIRKSCILG